MSNILCFTVSYNRPYYIYNTVNNILNQSFTDFNYSVRININKDDERDMYNKLLKDFIKDPRINICYGPNFSQHTNYLNAINNLYNNHTILVKIDDDDIYHKNYLDTGINLFNKLDVDILSFNAFTHINNTKIYNQMSSIGKWAGDNNQTINFGMPPTYFFNAKAFALINNLTDDYIRKIHLFEDAAWRTVWRKNNLKSIICDDEIFTYNIHGKNISSKFLYDNTKDYEPHIDNEYCSIYKFKHPHWTSFVYLNKRNNKVYNIQNDDHGSYKVLPNDIIQITWDEWGSEKFHKVLSGNFYEKIN